MTHRQTALLKRLIIAERCYWKEMMKGRGNMAEHRLRGVEVSRTFGVDPRTAESLCEAGLCYMVGDGAECRQTWIYLNDSFEGGE